MDSRAHALWQGNLTEGSGEATLGTGIGGVLPVSWPSRTEAAAGKTSPEELIAAAHSTCFSMSLSNELTKAGHTVETVDTKADVTFQPGKGITGSHLTTRATVPGLSAEEFATFAEGAKANCPVSAALTGTTITLDASLA
jgi:osmotically inducible protein OsmC